MPGFGAAPVPLAALLQAGAVGWGLSARFALTHVMEHQALTGSRWSLCCPGRILVYGHMKIKSPSFRFCYCLTKIIFISVSGEATPGITCPVQETWTYQKGHEDDEGIGAISPMRKG